METVGKINSTVIALLGLSLPDDTPIYMGPSNIAHMQQRHPADFAKYGADIPAILANPDYVGLNPKDDSIEYVKEYMVAGEYVKVAVRVALSGKFYARSLYVLNTNRVHNYIQKGTLKRT